jgi:hypothetical protein
MVIWVAYPILSLVDSRLALAFMQKARKRAKKKGQRLSQQSSSQCGRQHREQALTH